MISNVLFILAASFSLLATWLIVLVIREHHKTVHMQRWVRLCVVLSMVCTFLAMLKLGFIGSSGLVLTLATVAGFTTLLVQNLYLMGMRLHGIQGLGLLLLPLTALPLLVLPLLTKSEQWLEASSFLSTGHLLLSLAGYAVLTMAALYACMQLLLDRALKNKNIGFFVRAMPSLIDIENHLFSHVRWAIWLLGLSILTGLCWQWIEMNHFALLNHKVLLALFAWFILMLLFHLRKKAAWHHQRASKMVLFAYATLMLAYFGVKLIHYLL